MQKRFDDEIDYSQYYIKDKNHKSAARKCNGDPYGSRGIDPQSDLTDFKNNDTSATQDGIIYLPPTDTAREIPVFRDERDSRLTRNNSGKKSRIRRSKSRGFAIIVASILLMFFSTLLITDTLSNGYLLSSISNAILSKDGVLKRYYAIEMDSYPDQLTAKAVAAQLRMQGCAGYVIDDGDYKIIAEVYSSESDAKSVLRKLNAGGETAKIYTFEIKDVDYSIYPTSTRNFVKKALTYADTAHKKLYEVSQQLAKGEIDKHNTLGEISTLRDTLKNMLVDFESSCDNSVNDKNILSVRVEMTAVVACLENLLNANLKRPNLLCDMRYTNVLIINAFRALTQSSHPSEKLAQ